MKNLSLFLSLAASVAAAPTVDKRSIAVDVCVTGPLGFGGMQASSLMKRQSDSDTENELVDGECADVTVIFARGTLESGNVGSLAGPPMFDALDALLGISNIVYQGVDYAASVEGYLEGGDPEGASTMASLTEQAFSQCPDTQVVLSGYSQGAQVVHLAAADLPAATAEKVSAVVLFGDPDDGQALANIDASKVVTYCMADDLICDGLPIVLPAHLTYSTDAEPAAEFIEAHVTV